MSTRVRLKICGITNWADAVLAVDVGADMLGFNFHCRSPRFVQVRNASQIIQKLPRNVHAIGVFVNAAVDDVAAVAANAGLHGLQLHGDEPPEQVATLAKRWPVIKAFRVGKKFALPALSPYGMAHAFLLDGFSRTAFGGTGMTFDWSIARQAVRYGRIFVAGGLTVENVRGALQTARPYAVDVCSGVEALPGRKDAGKLLQFALLFHSAKTK